MRWQRRRPAPPPERPPVEVPLADGGVLVVPADVYDQYRDALARFDRAAAGKAARSRLEAHRRGCPAAPAWIPLEAVNGVDTVPRDRLVVSHPVEACRVCSAPVHLSTRATRSKPSKGKIVHRYIYCSPEHKALASDPEWQHAVDRAAAGLPPKTEPVAPEPEPQLPCPHPEKEAFTERADCEARFENLLAVDLTLHVYRCVCRRWHSGHAPWLPPRVDESRTIGAIARIIPPKKETPPMTTQPASPPPFGDSGTPMFDQLVVEHGHELWPPPRRTHADFMAAHRQRAWLAGLEAALTRLGNVQGFLAEATDPSLRLVRGDDS